MVRLAVTAALVMIAGVLEESALRLIFLLATDLHFAELAPLVL